MTIQFPNSDTYTENEDLRIDIDLDIDRPESVLMTILCFLLNGYAFAAPA